MKLFTKTVCPKCMLVKFELRAQGLEGKYEIINIDTNDHAKKELLDAGFMSVPVLEVNGELISDISLMKDAIGKMPV